jgi:hypothetical protein
MTFGKVKVQDLGYGLTRVWLLKVVVTLVLLVFIGIVLTMGYIVFDVLFGEDKK